MTAIHLHFVSDVGTTYKRALKRFHLSRDYVIPRDFSALLVIDHPDNWPVLTLQLRTYPMRKPRDYDAELKALNDKARLLRERKLVQLGELVVATGADVLPVEALAGALLAAADTKDTATKEAWRQRGATFFLRSARAAPSNGVHGAGGSAADGGGEKPPAINAGAA